MAAVDQHGELYGARTAAGENRLDRGAHRAPGVDHIIHQYHVAPGHVEGQLRPADGGQLVFMAEIVPVKADVDAADRDLRALDAADVVAYPLGDRPAAPTDADKHDIVRALIFLYDLMGDAHQRPRERRFVHELGLLSHLAASSGKRKILPITARQHNEAAQ